MFHFHHIQIEDKHWRCYPSWQFNHEFVSVSFSTININSRNTSQKRKNGPNVYHSVIYIACMRKKSSGFTIHEPLPMYVQCTVMFFTCMLKAETSTRFLRWNYSYIMTKSFNLWIFLNHQLRWGHGYYSYGIFE